ncbi:uncharacterized protein [Henckelia pumila]|uniref:uncharacterized protein n=1 Tax=Henckelia pumila TaxID=405737 RepID=UPI003C6E9A33
MAEENVQQPPMVPIKDHFWPIVQAHYSEIARGTINSNNFELKPALINMNVLNPPPGFNTNEGEGKHLLEDVVSTFVTESGKRMERTENCLDSLETHMVNMGAMIKSMETQIGQLANSMKDHNKGQFSSNTEVNPIEHCKAIELRSGKEVGVQEPAAEVEKKKVVDENTIGKKSELEEKPMYKPPLPYPQRFKNKVLDEQFSKLLEIFKKLHINIPFADALLQMPNYTKFLKEVMSKKRKLEEFETVNLTEECSAILQKKSLVLGEVKPTTIALQLADKSIKYPRGIIEDVLVKIDKFIFPMDFIVLDMEDDNIPLILGRPFLATAEGKIDVKKEELSMGVDDFRMSLEVVLSVSTPTSHSTLAKLLVMCCFIEFDGNELAANLMILVIDEFNCILGIDLLTMYRANVECYQNIVQFYTKEAIVSFSMVRENEPLGLWYQF